MTKTIPKKKKCKKAKWLSEEALHIAEERTGAKSKEEREKHTQLNAEFQRIARREKKAFLDEQFKETEGNSRMEKTRKFKEPHFLKFFEDLKSSMELEISREHVM